MLDEREKVPSARRVPPGTEAAASASKAGRLDAWQIKRRVAALFSHPSVALNEGSTGYFYGVDLIRGIAALSIIFWHYNHFFTERHSTASNPLYGGLWLLYEHGGNAVQLFWLISGFTFSSVYTQRRSSNREFAVHRLARLYPLHILTLVVIAVLQVVSLAMIGHFSIYQNNDFAHYVDQVLLTPGWGPTIRFSFNGPIWTVSVEILIYAVFWVTLPVLFRWGLLIPTAMAAVSLVLSRLGPAAHIFQGGFYFFTGCALLPVFLAFRSATPLMVALAVLPTLLAIAVFTVLHSVGIGSILLFVGALLAAAQVRVESRSSAPASLMKWMGDNTYGTYLWHVPVQVAILAATGYFGISSMLFQSPVFMIGYVVVVISLSRLSFMFYERPCRTYLNQRLVSSRRSNAAALG